MRILILCLLLPLALIGKTKRPEKHRLGLVGGVGVHRFLNSDKIYLGWPFYSNSSFPAVSYAWDAHAIIPFRLGEMFTTEMQLGMSHSIGNISVVNQVFDFGQNIHAQLDLSHTSFYAYVPGIRVLQKDKMHALIVSPGINTTIVHFRFTGYADPPTSSNYHFTKDFSSTAICPSLLVDYQFHKALFLAGARAEFLAEVRKSNRPFWGKNSLSAISFGIYVGLAN